MARLECCRETEMAIFVARTNLPVSDFQTWKVCSLPPDTVLMWSVCLCCQMLTCARTLRWRKRKSWRKHWVGVTTTTSQLSIKTSTVSLSWWAKTYVALQCLHFCCVQALLGFVGFICYLSLSPSPRISDNPVIYVHGWHLPCWYTMCWVLLVGCRPRFARIPKCSWMFLNLIFNFLYEPCCRHTLYGAVSWCDLHVCSVVHIVFSNKIFGSKCALHSWLRGSA